MNFKSQIFQDGTIRQLVNTNGHRGLVDPQDVGTTILECR